MFDIFQLNDKSIMLTADVLSIEAFRNIYERDTTPAKAFAHKELLYVYHSSSYKSFAIKKGLKGNDLHMFALSNSGMGNSYQPDTMVKKAISVYKELQESPIDEQIGILYNIIGIRNFALRSLANQLELKTRQLADEEQITKFFALSDKLSTFTAQFQKDVTVLKKIEEDVAEKENKNKKIYGQRAHESNFDSDDELAAYEKAD